MRQPVVKYPLFVPQECMASSTSLREQKRHLPRSNMVHPGSHWVKDLVVASQEFHLSQILSTRICCIFGHLKPTFYCPHLPRSDELVICIDKSHQHNGIEALIVVILGATLCACGKFHFSRNLSDIVCHPSGVVGHYLIQVLINNSLANFSHKD